MSLICGVLIRALWFWVGRTFGRMYMRQRVRDALRGVELDAKVAIAVDEALR
jgi:hypothetical protein